MIFERLFYLRANLPTGVVLDEAIEKKKRGGLIMEEKNVINFLLYSVLRVVPKSEENIPSEDAIKRREDELIEAAINRAYLDTCRVFSVQKEEKKDTRNDAVEKIKEEINEAVQKELAGEENYDNWHKELCKQLVKIYSNKTVEKRPFTYGIAQKWVNMTMKYLCVMKSIFTEYGHEDKLKIWDFIDKNEKNFHIPIDSFILEALSDVFEGALAEFADLPEENKETMPLLQRDGGYGEYSENTTLPWSQYKKDEKRDDYSQLRNNLKKVIEKFPNWVSKLKKDEKHDLEKELKTLSESPLDWESENWIRISNKRKKSN